MSLWQKGHSVGDLIEPLFELTTMETLDAESMTLDGETTPKYSSSSI